MIRECKAKIGVREAENEIKWGKNRNEGEKGVREKKKKETWTTINTEHKKDNK